MTNRETVALLLERLGKPWSLVRHVEDRPGPRPPLRDGRLQARRARLGAATSRSRTASPRRSTGSWPTSRGGGPPGSGDWDAYYERQYGRAPPARADLMRVAVTGADRAPRRRARGRPRRRAVHRARRADRPGTAPDFDLDAPQGVGALPRPRPARGRRPRRGLDRRRRLRPRPGPRRCRRNGDATGVLAAACAERGVDLLVVSTNEVFDGRRDDGARLRARRRRSPAEPVRGVEAGRRARRDATPTRRRRRPRRPPRHRPDGLAVRAARAATSRARSSRRRDRAAGRRRAAPGRRRRVGHADLRRRRRRRHRRAARPTTRTAGSTTSSTAADRDPRRLGPRTSSARFGLAVTVEEVPGDHLGARVDPAALGRPRRRRRCRPASRMRPWPRGDGRLRPVARARAGGRAMTAVDTAAARVAASTASATARSPGSPTRAARSASCGERRVRPHRPGRAGAEPTRAAPSSSRPTCRPRRPASCAACTSIGASSTTGSSPPAAPSSPSSTSGPCCGDAVAAPIVETRELDGRRLGRHPGRRRPRVPGPRAARAPLPRDRPSTTAPTSSGSPGTTRGRRRLAAVHGDARRPPDPVRPRPLQPVRCPSSWSACARGLTARTSDARDRTRTAPAPTAPPHRALRCPKGLGRPGPSRD